MIRQRRFNTNPIYLGGWALLLSGVAMLILAVYFIAANTMFWVNGDTAEGTVAGWQEMRRFGQTLRPGERAARAIAVELQLPSGDSVAFATDIGSQCELFTRGEKVTVIYDRDAPQHARVRGFMTLYFGPLMLLLFGAAFGFVGLLVRLFGQASSAQQR